MAFVIYNSTTKEVVAIENQAPSGFDDLTGCSVVETDIPEGEVSWDPDTLSFSVDLTKVRQLKKDELTIVRDEKMSTTVTNDFGTFFTDDKSKILMLGELLGILLTERMGGTPPATISFKTATGWQDFVLNDFISASLEVLSGIKGLFNTQKTLDDQIDLLNDPAQIAAVQWPT